MSRNCPNRKLAIVAAASWLLAILLYAFLHFSGTFSPPLKIPVNWALGTPMSARFSVGRLGQHYVALVIPKNNMPRHPDPLDWEAKTVLRSGNEIIKKGGNFFPQMWWGQDDGYALVALEFCASPWANYSVGMTITKAPVVGTPTVYLLVERNHVYPLWAVWIFVLAAVAFLLTVAWLVQRLRSGRRP